MYNNSIIISEPSIAQEVLIMADKYWYAFVLGGLALLVKPAYELVMMYHFDKIRTWLTIEELLEEDEKLSKK